MMRRRTRAREYALQLLYQVDVTRRDWQPLVEEFWTYHRVPVDVQQFATELVAGSLKCLGEIDRLITLHASNWEINRMAVVDRNILRLGAYELLYCEDVPPKVCLNEAIELAKRFGDEESSRFVNGILDTIHKEHARRASGASDSQPTGFPSS
jgi:N utilization substance protein B